MFTGLIESTGSILALTPSAGATRITVAAPALAARLNTGDSIAVSGVCLTALDIEPNAFPPRFSADLAAETIARTTLAHLSVGSIVNLEFPTPAGSPLGGHVVQGHVDGTATLISLEAITPNAPETDWRLRLRIPESLTRYVVPQGSITVEGISLTVAALHGQDVEIAIIPHTYAATSLHTLAPGSPLNIEVDVLGKYAERQMQTPTKHLLTEQYLLANGY
jgi:riboflavin synthase